MVRVGWCEFGHGFLWGRGGGLVERGRESALKEAYEILIDSSIAT